MTAEPDVEVQRREQAAAAALRAGLDLIQCGERGDQPTFNLIDTRGKRRRRVHVALTIDEVESVLNGSPNNICADAAENALGPTTEYTVEREPARHQSLREAMALPYGDYDGTPVEVDHEKLAADRANIAAQIEREKAPRPRSPKSEEARAGWATEQAKINVAEVDVVVMGAEEAREVTDQIRANLEQMWDLIVRAYTGRAWVALGHATWVEYCSAEFGTSHLRLPRDERPPALRLLREAGMSVRAIAAATGLGRSTVQREIEPAAAEPATVPNGTPEADTIVDEAEVIDEPVEAETVDEPIATVIGIDGKRHPAKREPKTAPQPAPADEPLMKSWEFTYRSDGGAEVSVEFFDHDPLCIPLGGKKLAARITSIVAADLAYHLRRRLPGITELIERLERGGEQS